MSNWFFGFVFVSISVNHGQVISCPAASCSARILVHIAAAPCHTYATFNIEPKTSSCLQTEVPTKLEGLQFHSPQATRRWHVPEGAGASTVWPEQITKQGRIATHQKVWPGGLGLMGQKEEVVFLPKHGETMWTLTFLKIKQEPFVTQKLENKNKFLLAISFSGFSPPSYTWILSPSKHADNFKTAQVLPGGLCNESFRIWPSHIWIRILFNGTDQG